MALGQEKIKEFFEAKTEKIATKIERTPMEKFFLVFLIIITVCALVLGVLQIRENVWGPLQSDYLDQKRGTLLAEYYNASSSGQAANANDAEIKKLQGQDSDLDGLDDYSELYLYQTSPYLEDSDGDGIRDKDEVLAGTNPRCAEGQDCSALEESAGVSSQNLNANTNTNLNANILDLDAIASGDMNYMTDLQNKLFSGEITLKDLGIDDPELQKSFDSIKTLSANEVSDLNPAEKASALDALKKMTPADIRKQLVASGLPQADVDKIDDQTLLQIFESTLGQYE